ncbi:hypothetical protein NDU88_001489 [Pleurodeles waltl]|uniref:Uncharacterized protein n=1 Tax=Pleurodeles waltl TaxID=8319 RepID=A0AAV7RB95_PLEWA|nr:hypothetical protein NDU88_001489 [Pleurodeles waltl]
MCRALQYAAASSCLVFFSVMSLASVGSYKVFSASCKESLVATYVVITQGAAAHHLGTTGLECQQLVALQEEEEDEAIAFTQSLSSSSGDNIASDAMNDDVDK